MTKTDIGIGIDKNMPAKLKAIAKHLNTMAEELEQINKESCPDCGTLGERIYGYADGMSVSKSKYYHCSNCGNDYFPKGD